MSEYLLQSLELMSAASELIDGCEELNQRSVTLRGVSSERLLDLDTFLAGFRTDAEPRLDEA